METRAKLATCTLSACLALATAAVIKNGNTLPTYRDACVRGSKGFDSCLKSALQALVPKLGRKGIAELDIDTIDPLYISQMIFNYDSLPDIGGKIVVNDTQAVGLTNIKIVSVKSDMDDKKFSLDVEFSIPRVVITGVFSMNGRVGLFPVVGNGPYNITTGEVTGTWKLRGIIEEDGEEKYVHLKSFGMRPSMGYFKVQANNIVRGNPQLTSLIIAFTNRFWQLLYNQSLPYFERNFDSLGKRLLNKVFYNVPYDQLFPTVTSPVLDSETSHSTDYYARILPEELFT